MENFFAFITVPIPDDEAEVWFNVHNMIIEKRQLFADFCLSLMKLVEETYLGDESNTNTNKIVLSQDEKNEHFDWCWKKTIENFERENIKFKLQGEHKKYMKEFLDEIFYDQKEERILENIYEFLVTLFDEEKSFTESDLTILTEIYKVFEKNRI